MRPALVHQPSLPHLYKPDGTPSPLAAAAHEFAQSAVQVLKERTNSSSKRTCPGSHLYQTQQLYSSTVRCTTAADFLHRPANIPVVQHQAVLCRFAVALSVVADAAVWDNFSPKRGIIAGRFPVATNVEAKCSSL